MAYHRVHGVDTRIVRIFNTYGPRMRLRDGRVVPAFISRRSRGEPLTVFGDGSQTRSFCYVADLIDGHLPAAACRDEHEPVNIGNPARDDDPRVRRRRSATLTGTHERDRVPAAARGRPEGRASPTSRRRGRGSAGSRKVPLEEGLRETIEYFRTSWRPRRAR